jgi:hypothetical protein
MKKMRMSLLCVVPLIGLCFGCVAIPVGKETYTAEFRGDIRAAAEAAAKTHEPCVAQGTVSGETFRIGLAGNVTTSQPQVQHYKQVTVAKRKVIGVGICPQWAPGFFHPKRALDRTTSYYKGSNADYSESAAGPGSGAMSFGRFLNGITVGTASIPFNLLYGIFGPFEQDWHYLGEIVQTNYAYVGRTPYITRIRDYGKIDLLGYFSPADRKKMGLWTWKENSEHPQNTFWHGFSSCSLAGICKYCDYVIRDPEETEKTTPASPRVTMQTREVKGPYAVTLELPEIGYRDTVDVAFGETMAAFPAASILSLANGRTTVGGSVRFRPPPGGWDEISDEDDRALLKAAMGRTWDVHFTLPSPAPKKPAPVPQPAEPESAALERGPVSAPVVEERALYAITAIEPSPNGILVVRVHVEDTSRTFEVDRLVRPEVVRLFREQFATGANAERREAVRWMTEDEGRTLVYRVGFVNAR